MELRGVKSDKQLLLSFLDEAYLCAKSEQDFYHRLIERNLELYSRNGKVVGVRMNRKFRFTTLGYTKEVLLDLDKSLSIKNRLEGLERIRERRKDRSRDREG